MKLDLGAGKNKTEGFLAVDRVAFPGIDHVCDLGREAWPFADGSVDEARASHFVEHLTPPERVHFVNELHRVLKKGGQCAIIVPHWSSCRAYGDVSHQWPPVTEFWFPYLDAGWRASQAPHLDAASLEAAGTPAGALAYRCDFACTQPGYSPLPTLTGKAPEFVGFAFTHYREAAGDMTATLIKK